MKGPQANQTSQEPGRQNDPRSLKKRQKLQLVKLFPKDSITSNTHWAVRSDTVWSPPWKGSRSACPGLETVCKASCIWSINSDAVMSSEVTAQSPGGRRCAGGTTDNTCQGLSEHFLQFCRRTEVEAEVKPGRLAIKGTNQAGARERYREGGKALQASPMREIGRGNDEQNRRQCISERGKKGSYYSNFLRHQVLLYLQLHLDTSLRQLGSLAHVLSFLWLPQVLNCYRLSGLKILVVKLEICSH